MPAARSAVTLTLGVPNFGGWYGNDPRTLVDLARAADDCGVDRLVVSDHVLLGRNTDAYAWGRFPTGPEAPWLEPLTTLTAMAAVTSRVRLATGILIAGLRPATVLAKTVATLDALSGGRVDLGVGVGWQREEYDAGGLDFQRRGRLLDETIAACRTLWSDLPASYAGDLVAFSDVFCSPKPVQERLPVWFAGTLNERNLRRIDELGDGWIPIMGATAADIRSGVQQLRERCRRSLDVQAPVRPVRSGDGGADVRATMAGVAELVDVGVTNVYVNIASFAPGPADAPAVLKVLVDEFRTVTA